MDLTRESHPISIGFTHVLEDTLIVPDVDADSNELRMAVDPDTVGLENLYLNTLVSFRSDNDFGTGIGYVDRHNKITPVQKTGAPSCSRSGENEVHPVNCGENDQSSVFYSHGYSGEQISSRYSQGDMTNIVRCVRPKLI